MNRPLRYLHQRLVELDRLLRGDVTRPDTLRDDRLNVSASGLAATAVVLAMLYGACMGSYALVKEAPPDVIGPYGRVLQFFSTIVKAPALFLLTLVVTLPSLYVSNALVGSRLTLTGIARLLAASLAVNVTVLASLGTIVLFFSVTTINYPFIRLLNVAAFTIAGVLGLMFLLQTLHRLGTVGALGAKQAESTANAEEGEAHETPAHDDDDASPGALDMPDGQALGHNTRWVFRCWVVLFALVGAQMGWVLRPFLGSPELPFEFFRERKSNFFAAVLNSLIELLGGA